MKNSLILYHDYTEKFKSLSDAQFGSLIRCMLIYDATGEIPTPDDAFVSMAFNIVKMDLDNNRAKYESIIERNRENGRKGGRPKTQDIPDKPKKPSGLFGNPDKPKKAVNVNDNDNVNVKVNDINNKKENTKRKKTPTVEESRVGKQKFADEVYLTEDEYMKLVRQYGQAGASRMIDILDSYKGSNGKTYLSDYKAILNWVVGRYHEEIAKNQREKPQSLAEKWGVTTTYDT